MRAAAVFDRMVWAGSWISAPVCGLRQSAPGCALQCRQGTVFASSRICCHSRFGIGSVPVVLAAFGARFEFAEVVDDQRPAVFVAVWACGPGGSLLCGLV